MRCSLRQQPQSLIVSPRHLPSPTALTTFPWHPLRPAVKVGPVAEGQRTGPRQVFLLVAYHAGASVPQTTFASGLLPLGHGYPLLQPVSGPTEGGVSLGDVGLLNKFGHFIVHFNLFGHPTSLGELPKYFEPIEPPLSQWNVKREPGYFPPCTALSSEGIQSAMVSEKPLNFEFKSSRPQGSILVLPDGASREDLVDIEALYPYIERRALDWYHYFNGYSQDSPLTTNGTVYVVTGADYTTTWATCLLGGGQEGVESTFSYDQSQGSGSESSNSCWAPTSMFSKCVSSTGPKQAGVFVRGLRVALGSAIWDKYYGRTSLHPLDHFVVLRLEETEQTQTTSPRGPRLSKVQRRLSRENPSPQEDDPFRPIYERIAFHPSNAALQVMLAKAPSANVLVIHDSVWGPVDNDVSLNWCLSCNVPFWHHVLLDELIRIFRQYNVEIKQGIAILTPKQPDTPNFVGKILSKKIFDPLSIIGGNRSPQQQRTAMWKLVYQYSFKPTN